MLVRLERPHNSSQHIKPYNATTNHLGLSTWNQLHNHLTFVLDQSIIPKHHYHLHDTSQLNYFPPSFTPHRTTITLTSRHFIHPFPPLPDLSPATPCTSAQQREEEQQQFTSTSPQLHLVRCVYHTSSLVLFVYTRDVIPFVRGAGARFLPVFNSPLFSPTYLLPRQKRLSKTITKTTRGRKYPHVNVWNLKPAESENWITNVYD